MLCASPKVLLEVENNSVLIVFDPQGILGQQLIVDYYYYYY